MTRWGSYFTVVALRGHHWLSLLVAVLTVALPILAQGPAIEKNVLILKSFPDRDVVAVDGLKSELRRRVQWPINFYVENLEGQRLSDNAYEKSAVETLRITYGSQKPDLVIAQSYPALQFILRHRDELFPNVPIVFWDMDVNRIVGQQMWPGVTGVTEIQDVRGTIDLALGLHPDTENIAIITENSEYDKYWVGRVHAELVRLRDKVKEIDLVGLPAEQLLRKVAALPPRTIALFQEYPRDSIEPGMGVYDLISRIGQRLPTYCLNLIACLGHGGIGGVSYDLREQASLAAALAARVLSGESPDRIPAVKTTGGQTLVDWRQLHRWNIAESQLPPGSSVLYREPTIWGRYRILIFVALAVMVVQGLLILGLLWQRARKRNAEVVLRESENRFRLMADSAPALIWMCDQQGQVTYLNDRRIAFTGPDSGSGYDETWTAFVHPEDLRNVLNTLAQALKNREPFSKEYRLRRRDGAYRWMFDVASPRMNGDGSFAGFIGSAIDITDQKLAHEALEKVSGRLIEAQEKERSRIARDLHDDICQRLALLSMELERANRSQNDSSPSTKQRLEEIRKHCSEIAGDVQSLSHELHSSKLDYLGIAAGIRGFCKEFAIQHEVRIDVTDRDVPTHLPRDVSLCLFRVAQESLHNAAKHSGTSRFSVELSGSANDVQLEVHDAGAGFNVEEVNQNGGLGLVSMQERVHLVHGRLEIESSPGTGTRIVAIVPLAGAGGGAVADEEDRNTASATEAA